MKTKNRINLNELNMFRYFLFISIHVLSIFLDSLYLLAVLTGGAKGSSQIQPPLLSLQLLLKNVYSTHNSESRPIMIFKILHRYIQFIHIGIFFYKQLHFGVQARVA